MSRKSSVYLGSLGALGALGFVAWSLLESPEGPGRQQEVALRELRLGRALASTEAELSGLAWWEDQLLLLPQYPERYEDSVFAISRADLERAIDGDPAPLTARAVPFLAPSFDPVEHDGYEAIAVDGDQVFVSLELNRDDEAGPCGRILRGRVEGALERVVIEPAPSVELEPQNHLANTSYEALLLPDGAVVALYETNGEVNPNPRALLFDRELAPLASRPVAPIEYRVTDATDLDEEGRFWVSNYHWPGAPWHTGTCSITERFGQGESHARCRTVERLVELQLTDAGVQPTDRPPLLLRLIDDEHPRNWEGVVRIGDRGFLLVTDEHPSTILAFVPAP